MLDNELFAHIRTELKERLAAFTQYDLSDVKVKRSYQPTQQNTGDDRLVVIHRISNPQVGGGIVYNGTNRVEQKFKRATFQFDSLAPIIPSDETALTANDILTISADLLQSYSSIRNLREKGVNIERVTDVRPSYFINDKSRFESSPSFDLTVNYQHDYENETPSVEGVTGNYYGE